MGATSGEEEDGPEDDLLEMFDISDDGTGAVGEGDNDAGVEELGWGEEPGV